MTNTHNPSILRVKYAFNPCLDLVMIHKSVIKSRKIEMPSSNMKQSFQKCYNQIWLKKFDENCLDISFLRKASAVRQFSILRSPKAINNTVGTECITWFQFWLFWVCTCLLANVIISQTNTIPLSSIVYCKIFPCHIENLANSSNGQRVKKKQRKTQIIRNR